MRKQITSNIIGPSELSPGFHNYGLCNQLFQIATCCSYAIDNDYDAVFPCLRDRDRYGEYPTNIMRHLCFDDFIDPSYTVYQEPKFGYTPIPKLENSIVVAHSYCQSHKYFEHNRDHILNLFSPRPEDTKKIHDKYGDLLTQNTTSCHIRRGDYTKLKDVHSPLYESDYYNRSFDLIKPDQILMFSDDIDWCKENFKQSNITFIENETDYIDLFIMSLCNNNIIANSTFSWWGAWLNSNENKKVVCPSSWFESSGAEDLVVDGWEVL